MPLKKQYMFSTMPLLSEIWKTGMICGRQNSKSISIRARWKMSTIFMSIYLQKVSRFKQELTDNNDAGGQDISCFTARNLFVDVNTAMEHLTNAFSIVGSGTRFSIGSLSPGDEAEIRFTLLVDSQAQTAVSVEIKIHYTDAAGARRLIEKKLPVKLSSGMAGTTSKDAKGQHEAMHGGGSNISKQAISFAPYLGIVLLGIIGFWQRKSISETYQRLKFQRQRRK